jgi:LacI family transcriptional regulator
MATIEAVAQHAGVSIASVSRVINGTVTRVETERRVREAINKLGYQTNSAARALKVRHSDQICLSFDDLRNPAYIAMTRGISRSLQQSKFRLVLSSAFSSVDDVLEHLESMGSNYADGLIISPIYSDPRITKLLLNLQVPVVLIGTLPSGLEVDNIHIDSALGIELAVEHLRSVGRKKIGLINGPTQTNPGRRRRAGFQKSMKKFDMQLIENSIIDSEEFTSEGGYLAAKSIKSFAKYDALICANDLIAAGVMKFLHERSIEIPKDIAIIGMDNIEQNVFMRPTLTSVDLLAELRGEMAAQMMIERLANPNLPIKKLVVKPELVIRDSTAGANR